MKKILAITLICLVLLGSMVGCSRNDENTLYFLNFKPESAAAYNKIAAKYKEETGKTLRVVTAASGTYEQTLKSEISKSDAPVLFQLNGVIGYNAWKDYCKDLSDTEIYKHLSDPQLAISSGEGVYGIPAVVEGYGIIYNKEITDRYFALTNRATKYASMDEIRSFEALSAMVRDMTAHKDELGIRGVFAATSLKSGEDWRFQTHLANLPIYYEFEKGNIDISRDDISEVDFSYNTHYKQLFDLYLNNSTTDPKLLGSKQVADSMAEFALGQCAMVQNGNWAWSQIQGVNGNTVKSENIKFLPIYIGAEGENTQGLCVGTENYFAINAKATPEKQKLAEDFLAWLYTSESGKDLVTNELGFIAPYDTFEEDEAPSDPLGKEVYEWMNKDGVNTVPWVFSIFPSQNFKSDFGAALLQYAQGNKEWSEVVSLFKTRWKEESA
ncbi:MAG: ABC transporter substrate-binding protein [Clostridia bacterium]|nr:ABC transporter substrate-binding protein [Clostridia bacterium]